MQYECDGFLDKNRDTVFEELINILKASQVHCFLYIFSSYVCLSPKGLLTGASVCLWVSLSWWLSCFSSREICPLWPMEVFAQGNEPPENTNSQWASRWALVSLSFVDWLDNLFSFNLPCLFCLCLRSSVSPCSFWQTPSTAPLLIMSAVSSPTISKNLLCRFWFSKFLADFLKWVFVYFPRCQCLI